MAMGQTPPDKNSIIDQLRRNKPATLMIAATVGAVLLLFAWAGGWFGGRLQPNKIADALQVHDGLHDGFRRAHAKGFCFTGHFDGNGQGTRLSTANVFAQGQSSVIGRFSTGGGMPASPDGRLVFRAIALSITAPNGEVWRTGMDSTAIFPVATPKAFMEFLAATSPGADGKPDPAKVEPYMAAHPETVAFGKYLKDQPLASSFVNTRYYSINAFRFIAGDGTTRAVRWSLDPTSAPEWMDKAKLADMPRDFLFDDLVKRAAAGPLTWDMSIQLAAVGDKTDNATVQWPQDRESVAVGRLTIDHVITEDDGPCRDINFDPLALPTGIEGSDDPLLAARSAVYSSSFRRRAAEGPHPSFARESKP
jgi:catalase